MAETHGVGRYFFHKIHLRKDSPRYHRWQTNEIDEPYRVSNSVIVRVFGTHGIVLGRWRDSGWNEDEALLDVLGREMEANPDEIDSWTHTLEK